MKKDIMILLGIIAITLCSCMVVVDENDGRQDKKTDKDSVTIIFSEVPTGIAP